MHDSSFVGKLDENGSVFPFHIDQQEQKTILKLVNHLISNPELRMRDNRSFDRVSVRVLATCVAFQETIVLPLSNNQVGFLDLLHCILDTNIFAV